MMSAPDRTPEELQVLLSVVREAFDRKGTWPIRQHVEAVLDQDHYLDLDKVLGGAPRSLVYASGTQEDSEVVLTVPGLAAAGAERDVRRFVEALRWCVDAQLGFRPSDPDVREDVKIGADQFESEWVSRGEEVSDTDLVKLRAMLLTEGAFSSLGGEGKKWTITLDRRRVLPYRDVHKVADYLALKSPGEPLGVEQVASAPAVQISEVPPPQAAPDLGEVPAKVREASGRRFAGGHFDSAVLEAVKVMGDVLREASGLTVDGEKLAQRAFGGSDPPILLGDLGTETGQSRQRGVMFVAQGIFAAIRNPLAHERLVVPPAEARRMLAMVTFVIEAVEARR